MIIKMIFNTKFVLNFTTIMAKETNETSNIITNDTNNTDLRICVWCNEYHNNGLTERYLCEFCDEYYYYYIVNGEIVWSLDYGLTNNVEGGHLWQRCHVEYFFSHTSDGIKALLLSS